MHFKFCNVHPLCYKLCLTTWKPKIKIFLALSTKLSKHLSRHLCTVFDKNLSQDDRPRTTTMCTFSPSSCTVQLLPADAARILPWSQHCRSSAPFQVFSLYPTFSVWFRKFFLLWYLTWMNIALNSLFPIHGSSYSVRKKRRMNYYYRLTHCWSRGIFLRPSGEGNCRSSARWHWWRSWLRREAGQWRGRPTYSKLFLYFYLK